MAPAKSTASNVDFPEPLAAAKTTPAAAATAHVGGLPQSGYLTAEWVKRHYSISNSTLYKWIADSRNDGGNGFPAPVKIGPRAVRWTAASLRAFEAKLMEDGR